MNSLKENEARLLEIREALVKGEISEDQLEAIEKEISELGEEREQLVAQEAAKAEAEAPKEDKE